MPPVIVVRIVPAVPTDGDTFTEYLSGLSLTAYDRTVRDTSLDLVIGENDVSLGTASGLAPFGPSPILTVTPGSNPPSYDNSIVQHRDETALTARAAATALIVVNLDLTSYPEYADHTAFDVRMAVSRNGVPVSMPLTIEYNIIPSSVPDISTAPNTYDWVTGTLPASLYTWIPPPPPSNNIASVNLGDPSTPPNFYTLSAAVDKVLALDAPSSAPSLESLTLPLTIAQCSEIASEITYERHTDPPPEPTLPPGPSAPTGTKVDVGLLYTTTTNQGPIPTGSSGLTYVRDFVVFNRSLVIVSNILL